jgi:hypothetical protein
VTTEAMYQAANRMTYEGSHPHTCPPEYVRLCKAASSPDLPTGHLLEIGSAFGGTLHLLALANAERGRKEQVWSCDPISEHWGCFRTHAMVASLIAVCKTPPEPKFLMISVQELESLGVGRVFRMIYLDAWHDYKNVWEDLRSAARLTLHGGLIFAHDVNNPICPGAIQAWNEIIEQKGIEDGDGRWMPDPGFTEVLGVMRWTSSREKQPMTPPPRERTIVAGRGKTATGGMKEPGDRVLRTGIGSCRS